jgi:redox-sensitive bicupin YhaK (pirin superfamily)
MITIRPADDRGHVKQGWLESWHSFSFSSYQDPRWMRYGALRVLNEDRVAPRAGFPPHSHQDMEIISYVLSGALRHRDSTGGGSVIRRGDVQLMSAGRGISHSEMNDSESEPVHFLQIWVLPRRTGVAPGYQQQAIDPVALHAGFVSVAGPQGTAAPLHIEQDARLLLAWPRGGQRLEQPLNRDRRYYLHVARGEVALAGRQPLGAGDAGMIDDEAMLDLSVQSDAELLLLDLA